MEVHILISKTFYFYIFYCKDETSRLKKWISLTSYRLNIEKAEINLKVN